jgi:serine/threonine protein kinase
MVEREKKILLNLNHPHVVKLKEVIEGPNKRTTYMVFEYIPGGELFRHLVSNGPMSEPEARRMFRQVRHQFSDPLFTFRVLTLSFFAVGVWTGISTC